MDSNKSQPIKIVIGVILVGLVCYFGVQLTANKPLGAIANSLRYTGVTNTTVTCPATAQQIQATSTGRTSFVVTNNSTNTITICRDTACTAGASGLVLQPTTASAASPGFNRYEQTDGYYGPYSCVASNGSSTLGASYSN